jgi:hypothetical protein
MALPSGSWLCSQDLTAACSGVLSSAGIGESCCMMLQQAYTAAAATAEDWLPARGAASLDVDICHMQWWWLLQLHSYFMACFVSIWACMPRG